MLVHERDDFRGISSIQSFSCGAIVQSWNELPQTEGRNDRGNYPRQFDVRFFWTFAAACERRWKINYAMTQSAKAREMCQQDWRDHDLSGLTAESELVTSDTPRES